MQPDDDFVEKTTVRSKAELPPWLAFCTFASQRIPLTCLVLCVLFACSAVAFVEFLDILPLAMTIPTSLAWVVAFGGIILLGQSIKRNQLLQEAVHFCEGASFHGKEKAHYRQANIEGALVSAFVLLEVVGIVGVHIFLLLHELQAESTRKKYLVGVNGAVVDFSEDPQSKDATQIMRNLNEHLQRAKKLFDLANSCATDKVCVIVAILYVSALALLLAFVAQAKGRRLPPVGIFVIFAVGALCVILATGLLHSLTTVAEKYMGCATDMNHDLMLRYEMSKLIPSAAGVKMLSSFESEFVNEFSFSIHQSAITRRTLEITLFRLFMGGVLTVALGILKA